MSRTHHKTGAEPATAARMDGYIFPRFGRWLDFTIALAIGLWCL
jgi:hypothetical protein